MKRLFNLRAAVVALLGLAIGSITSFAADPVEVAPPPHVKVKAVKPKLGKPMDYATAIATFVEGEKEAAAAKEDVKPKVMTVTVDGVEYRLVDREKMRVHPGAKKFSVSSVTAKEALKDVKPAPSVFDYTHMKNGTAIQFPILGNDRYGDCFYVAPVHLTQSLIGMRDGIQLNIDQNVLVKRYLQLSPRDQGLSDDDIMPEWKNGIIGPNGKYKILDWATIDPKDAASVKTAMYYLGGMVTTHSLRTTWMNNIRDGMLWDVTGRIDPSAGHAVAEHGVNGDGNFVVSTWGKLVFMTPAGLANSNAEVIVVVAMDLFDAKGYTPNGTHYTEIAKVWEVGTGRKLPQGIFPDPNVNPPTPPTPPVPPTPTPGNGLVTIDPVNKVVTIPDASWTVKGGGGQVLPPAPGVGGANPALDHLRKLITREQAIKDGARELRSPGGLLITAEELAAAKSKVDAGLDDAALAQLAKEANIPVGGDNNKAGRLTDFLDWVIAHKDQIASFIEFVIKLLSGLAEKDKPNDGSEYANAEVDWILAA